MRRLCCRLDSKPSETRCAEIYLTAHPAIVIDCTESDNGCRRMAPIEILIIITTGTLGAPRDVGREGRARSVSAFTGLTISETEGDGVMGNGGSGLSPPYLEFSTQLMSTSPQAGTSIGKVGMARLDRSQGALTLYQMPSQRTIVAEDRVRSSDSALHQNQLAVRYHYANEFICLPTICNLSLYMTTPPRHHLSNHRLRSFSAVTV